MQVIPTLVAHADWGTQPGKRWLACATLAEDGRYRVGSPVPVEAPESLLRSLFAAGGGRGSVLVSFDFPIGLPLAYAQAARIESFVEVLPTLGSRFHVCFRRGPSP